MFYIQWHITNKCNLRCIHCYQDNFTSSNDLKWQELKKICDNVIETLKKWDKKLKITITGGEPFLHNDVWAITDYLDSSDQVSELNFITNGTFIDKYISLIGKINKLNKIFVSLDGVSHETNDSIRKKGVYEKVIRNIKLLKSEEFNIVIMFTLMRKNLDDAKLLYDFAKYLGIDGYIIERFIPLGTGRKIKDEVVSGEEICQLYRYIFDKSDTEFDIAEIAKFRALQVRFRTSGNTRGSNLITNSELYGAPCTAGRDGIAILPDGDVLPCRRFYAPMGNLLNQSLDCIWSSSDLLKNICNRNNLEGKCGKCEIIDCYGCRAIALALTGNCLAEDPQCFLK